MYHIEYPTMLWTLERLLLLGPSSRLRASCLFTRAFGRVWRSTTKLRSWSFLALNMFLSSESKVSDQAFSSLLPQSNIVFVWERKVGSSRVFEWVCVLLSTLQKAACMEELGPTAARAHTPSLICIISICLANLSTQCLDLADPNRLSAKRFGLFCWLLFKFLAFGPGSFLTCADMHKQKDKQTKHGSNKIFPWDLSLNIWSRPTRCWAVWAGRLRS